MTIETKEELHGQIATWAAEKTLVDLRYKELKDLESQIIFAIKDLYPEEYRRWERGVATLTLSGVTLQVSRSYDVDKVRALLGEERPDLITTETKVIEKVDGKKMLPYWKDAAMHAGLSATLNPAVPKLRIAR